MSITENSGWGEVERRAREFELYPLEYRRTRCLMCAKPLREHRKFTQADIDASKGATYENPVNGYRAPLSPTLIGQWMHHEPMPWKNQL